MQRAIFITVRSASTRLPAKCYLEIEGVPTIVHVIRRMKRCRKADGIIVCTTDLPEDDRLCRLAEAEGALFFRGSVKDKLARWQGAARHHQVEFFVTADGDDLLCEPELVDMAFDQYGRTQADFIEGKGLVCGSFTYGIAASALEKVCQMKDTDDTEMMWVYFTQTGMFKTEALENVPHLFVRDDIRMTLDYQDDFIFFQKIFSHFWRLEKKDFSLRDVIAFLGEHPDIIKINQHRQEEFLQNQKKKTNLVLKGQETHDKKS